MARTVGVHIRRICKMLEILGPSGGATIHDHLHGVTREQIGKYLGRAVGLGLATVERGLGSRSNYNVYTVVPGWQEMVDQRRTTKLPAPTPRKEAPAKTRWAGISSIFGMGAT